VSLLTVGFIIKSVFKRFSSSSYYSDLESIKSVLPIVYYFYLFFKFSVSLSNLILLLRNNIL